MVSRRTHAATYRIPKLWRQHGLRMLGWPLVDSHDRFDGTSSMSKWNRDASLDRRQMLQIACAAGAGLVAGGAARMAHSAEAYGFVDSDGFKIHYETFGEGAPIVLVHGWGASLKTNWIDTGWVAALRKVRRVVALDVRGHDDSDKPHQQSVYSYAKMSRDVLRVMDHLRIAKADYLGYSMGACMGVSRLGHSRQRFTSMTLGGIGDETDESLAALPKIVAGLRAKNPEELTDPVSSGYLAFADRDPRNDREALAASALQMWPEGFPLQLGGPRLSDVDIPVARRQRRQRPSLHRHGSEVGRCHTKLATGSNPRLRSPDRGLRPPLQRAGARVPGRGEMSVVSAIKQPSTRGKRKPRVHRGLAANRDEPKYPHGESNTQRNSREKRPIPNLAAHKTVHWPHGGILKRK